MKAVIFAGGLGTRLSEETEIKPKPMVEIGGKPILWHIMKIYSHYGINEFIICCGYKGYMIKEFFSNYFLHTSDITFCLKTNTQKILQNNSEPWEITLVDTGENTMTGGRLKKVKGYLEDEKSFCLTYGDGLSNIDLKSLISFHHSHGRKATVTATRPPGRYGALKIDTDGVVDHFQEKPDGDGSWINGGFFILSPDVIDTIEADSIAWEKEPLSLLAENKELVAFKHEGFWQPMDTMREKYLLNQLWESGQAPWRVWS
jgi:glucose-1-phosphate cytidylyltransferase